MEEFTNISIEDGNIYKVTYGSKTLIGCTLDKFSQVENLLEEAIKKSEHYYDLCVKNGLITPKLTQEEINNNITQTLATLTDMVCKLNERIDVLSVTHGEGSNEYIKHSPKSKPKSKITDKSTQSLQDCETV